MAKKATFRERLSTAMDMRGIGSLSELSRRTGIHKGQLSKYKNGIIEDPSDHIVDLLSDALKVSPEWLRGYVDDTNSENEHGMSGFGNLTAGQRIDLQPLMEAKLRAAMEEYLSFKGVAIPNQEALIELSMLALNIPPEHEKIVSLLNYARFVTADEHKP